MTFKDCSSMASLSEFFTNKYELSWDISFDQKIISGSVRTYFTCLQNTKVLSLNTKDLSIKDVFIISEDGKQKTTKFTLQKSTNIEVFGSLLVIDLPDTIKKDQQLVVLIIYETSPKCSALQWMTPEQTCGKKAPYLFSQCQAIHARSLFPCQDSPSVKAPYIAKVTAPKGIQVLMGAIKGDVNDDEGDSSKQIHSFNQDIPIPSYLLALAAGNLVKKDISDQMAVWSEPEMIDSCYEEFRDCGSMLQVAESICGPYVWGRYDMLVLPPSFPYGGMENPCLTFLTPTLIAGDKSLVNVIAHELSHSWTGNLVTNNTWEHFWLNEGHTVYLERLIEERLHGTPSRHLAMSEGWNSLQAEVVERRGVDDPLTCLVVNLEGVDPDDAFSCVPYEKGSGLLYYLETLVGQPLMLKWLRAYFDKFAKQSLNTDQWKDFFLNFIKSNSSTAFAAVEAKCDWSAWLHQPGLPPVSLLDLYDKSLIVCSENLADKWSTQQDLSGFTLDVFAAMETKQKVLFFDKLINGSPLPHAKLDKMRGVYGLDDVKNAEVLFRWFRLCLKARFPYIVPLVLKFLDSVGRMKFARPLYKDLFGWPERREEAVKHFEARRASMHPITAEMVARDMAKA